MVGNPLGHKKEYSPFAGFEEAEVVNSGEVQASEVGSGRGSACCRGCARVWAGPPCLPGMTWGQALFVALAVSSLVYLSVDAFTRRLSLRVIDWCLQDSLASGSIVVLSLVFASLTVLLVALGYPMSLLCVLGGYLYSKTLGEPLGILVSTIVTSVATTLGCVLSFVVTRAVLRERASEWVQSSSTLEGLDVALRQQGLRVNLLMRLSPIVPYGFLNLAMGLTATSLDDYTLGCLGILPSAIVLSYFGTALTKLQDLGSFADRRPAEMAVLYVSGALLVVWVATTLYLATKRAIAQVVKRRESLVDSYGWEL